MHTDESIITAVHNTMPAVVSVVVAHELSQSKKESRRPMLQEGGGSGFLVEPHGTVLTNRHVIHDSSASYIVVLDSEEEYPAEVIARDPLNDVGILRIDLRDHPVITLGDSRNLALGQTAIAIGNALGQFRNTVSVGVVSGLSRSVVAGYTPDDTQNAQNLRGLIQTDAAINPGNSGGPLINLNGNAIGINAAVIMGAQNISFAIPVHNAARDLEHLTKHGRLMIPYVGLRYITLTSAIQKKVGGPLNHGAMVLREGSADDHAVAPGSPADKAGIREGDIIIDCAGTAITPQSTLVDIVQDYDVGDTIECTLIRNDKEKRVAMKLGERT